MCLGTVGTLIVSSGEAARGAGSSADTSSSSDDGASPSPPPSSPPSSSPWSALASTDGRSIVSFISSAHCTDHAIVVYMLSTSPLPLWVQIFTT